MTIADAEWRSPRGIHVTTIGPLPIKAGTTYSALYMEASMRPGMKSAVHLMTEEGEERKPRRTTGVKHVCRVDEA
jgi:hypothetical protein